MGTIADDGWELRMGEQLARSWLPLITPFVYAASFSANQYLLISFKESNPTWMVAPGASRTRLRLPPGTVRAKCIELAEYLYSHLMVTRPDSNRLANIQTGSTLNVYSKQYSFDPCFASLPRRKGFDNIKSSIPELSVLELREKLVAKLHRQAADTPVVGSFKKNADYIPNKGNDIVGRDCRGRFARFCELPCTMAEELANRNS